MKLHRESLPQEGTTRANVPLELVHSDICNPMQLPTHTSFKYFITFIDDYSKYTVVYILRNKSQAFSTFQKYKAIAENKMGRRIQTLRNDNGR
jgi:hypothetical protein